MSKVLQRLLLEDFNEWENKLESFKQRNLSIKVPKENNLSTLHQFNCSINDLYTEVEHDFAIARTNRDAIDRLIKNVIDDHYSGSNDRARKAAGIQFAKKYPVKQFYHEDYVDLFELEYQFNKIYYSLDAVIKSLKAKADAKITSNSLLNIERSLIPS